MFGDESVSVNGFQTLPGSECPVECKDRFADQVKQWFVQTYLKAGQQVAMNVIQICSFKINILQMH